MDQEKLVEDVATVKADLKHVSESLGEVKTTLKEFPPLLEKSFRICRRIQHRRGLCGAKLGKPAQDSPDSTWFATWKKWVLLALTIGGLSTGAVIEYWKQSPPLPAPQANGPPGAGK